MHPGFLQLLSMVRKGVESGDADFAENCRISLADLEEKALLKPTANCRMFYDFGFLLVRQFKDGFEKLGDDFASRYYNADFEYIKNLASNLGII